MSVLRAVAHVGGEQQLAARRRPEPARSRAEAALVGHGELPDLLDRVAPELDADRVLLVRREDVEDAAAHGELAASLDQLDPGVGDLDQPGHGVVEDELVPRADGQRLEVPEATHLRLKDRTHRCDDDRQPSSTRVVRTRVSQPPEYGEAAAHRVGSW